MSRGLFDLGARLQAANAQRPVPVATFAPVLPPVSPIAVWIDHDGERVYVSATDGTHTHAGTDRDGLAAIAACGASMTGVHRTLVVGTTADMGTLAALARRFPGEDASPVIGWWDQRSDHPGTEAVHVVTTAARLRWVLGVHPDLERDVETWRSWLGVTDSGATGLLAIAYRTAEGPTLPGLLDATNGDVHSWDAYCGRVKAGRAWSAPDTRTDAALGLATRSHAGEWFDSLRLDDPRVALAASFDGTVIPGTVTTVGNGRTVIQADQALSRLRVDTKVTAWKGGPLRAGSGSVLSGTVDDARISRDGHLSLHIGDLPQKPKNLAVGDRITLRPGRVDPYMQTMGRRRLAAGYRRGGNWIAGRGTPIMRPGTVPFDVIVAAAED